MSDPKEVEFSEHLTGGEEVSGEIGGEIFVPVEAEEEGGTLDEPVMTTLVSVQKQLASLTLKLRYWLISSLLSLNARSFFFFFFLTHQKRDLKAIFKKCLHVLIPIKSNKSLLHDCELRNLLPPPPQPHTQDMCHVYAY